MANLDSLMAAALMERSIKPNCTPHKVNHLLLSILPLGPLVAQSGKAADMLFEALPMRLGVQSPAAGSRLTQPSILPRSVNEYPSYLLGGKERLGEALANLPV